VIGNDASRIDKVGYGREEGCRDIGEGRLHGKQNMVTKPSAKEGALRVLAVNQLARARPIVFSRLVDDCRAYRPANLPLTAPETSRQNVHILLCRAM